MKLFKSFYHLGIRRFNHSSHLNSFKFFSKRVFCSKTPSKFKNLSKIFPGPSWSMKQSLKEIQDRQKSINFSKEQVEHLSKISRISIKNEQEFKKIETDLRDIVCFLQHMQKVNTENIPPLYSVIENQPLWERADEPNDEPVLQSIQSEKLFRTFVQVPRIRKEDVEE